MAKHLSIYCTALALQALVLAPVAAQYADDPEATEKVLKGRPYSPYADRAFPTDVYFGDTHVHTALSADAGGGGTTAAAARRLPLRARRAGDLQHRPAGEAVAPVRLLHDHRPLRRHGRDHRHHRRCARTSWPTRWAASSTTPSTPAASRRPRPRSSSRGVLPGRTSGGAELSAGQSGVQPRLGRHHRRPPRSSTTPASSPPSSPSSGRRWSRATTCTATSSSATGRSGPARSSPTRPRRRSARRNPRDLWAWLQNYEDKTGGDVLAIPHNGNLSNGMMFALQDDFADGAAARRRLRRAAPEVGAALRGDARSRATARPIRCSRPRTSSPTSRPGTWAISISPRRRRPRCSPANTRAPACSAA